MDITINGIMTASMTISGVYLALRAWKMKNIALAFLSAAMLSFFSTILVNIVFPPDMIFPRSVAAANYAIFLVLFTKHAFYKDKKSIFKIVSTTVVILRAVHFTEMNLLGFAAPSYIPITPSQLGWYYFHLVVLTSQLAIAFSWLGFAALNEHVAMKAETVEPWVRNRYLVIGTAYALFAIASLAYFIVPTDGLALGSPDAFLANVIIVPTVVAHSALSLLAWTMPGWFKRLLNAGKPSRAAPERQEIFEAVSKDVQDRAITTPELMNVIDYIGGKLASKLNKSPGAVKGLFLMAIDKELGELGLYTVNLSKLILVTNNSLKNLLMDIGIDGAEAIVADLARDLVKNQSLLLMMSI